jgi:hypothetical protein
VVTVKNSSGNPLPLREVSILTPYRRSIQGRSSKLATPSTQSPTTQFSCPCMPALPFDGSEVDSTIVTIPPDQEYVKTTASFPPPTLETDASADVPGCEEILDAFVASVC